MIEKKCREKREVDWYQPAAEVFFSRLVPNGPRLAIPTASLMSPHHDGRDSFPQFSARERGDNDLLRPLLQEEEMKPTGAKTSPLSSIHHHRAGKTQSKTRRPQHTTTLVCVCGKKNRYIF